MIASRAALVLLAGVVTTVAAGCGSTAPSSPPPGSASEPPSTATPAAGSPVAPQEGRLRSDSLVGLEVWADASTDRVTFGFDAPSRPDVASTGSLRSVEPPFAGVSGEAIEVAGDHHVEVRFDGMHIHDDQGNATYQGERSMKPGLPAVRQVELIEAFEGVVIFVIGYDGSGCVALAAEGSLLTIAIGH